MLYSLNCFKYADNTGAAEITHQVSIKATEQRVYAAITRHEGLLQWRAKQVDASYEEGYTNLFYDGVNDVVPMHIMCLQPYNYVEWKCLLAHEDCYNTTVRFDIRQKNGTVIINFKHSGWAEQNEYFSVWNFNWARHLLNLKTFCETGQGLQNTLITMNGKT